MAKSISEDYDPSADEIVEEAARPNILQHPEKRLLEAILKDAIKEIKKRSKHSKAALEWLEDDEEQNYPWTFSFSRDAAPELKLDVQATRDALTGRKESFKNSQRDNKKRSRGRPKN